MTPLVPDYDILYPGRSYWPTHPDHLATLAHLFGLSPAPVDSCRVLELGCSSGENLIPMAAGLPESRFIGVDRSARHIEQGRLAIEKLGLANVELVQADILDLADSEQPYDYLICHGVFSWVDQAVRERILTLCRKGLAPHGVAYLSYNTFPGWHLGCALRDMLKYHVPADLPPEQQVQQARALVAVLRQILEQEEKHPLAQLAGELNTLERCEDGHLFWEYLVEVNQPFLLHQFVSMAEAQGLRYLGDAEHTAMLVDRHPPVVQDLLVGCEQPLRAQQYLDFLHNRRFRMTLLCLSEREVQPAILPERLNDLAAWGRFRIERMEQDPEDRLITAIVNAKGKQVELLGLPVRIALQLLQDKSPEAVGLSSLLQQVRQLCQATHPMQRASLDGGWLDLLQQDLANKLTTLFFDGFIELVTHRPPVLSTIPQWPRATALARYQATVQPWVTNQYHRVVHLDDLSREILKRLDGTRNIEELVVGLRSSEAARDMEQVIRQTGGSSWSVQNALEQVLRGFREAALLVP
ncbi:MAG: class I SAM-dependent methyltransferase [Bradymonadales bacterium]|nr:class I SAM-dependent methyltransferase [Bradymonadales bacterium]